MQYVSSIKDDNGLIVDSLRYGLTFSSGSVMISSVGGGSEAFMLDDIGDLGFIGVGTDPVTGDGVIIKYSEKALELLGYVVLAETLTGVGAAPYKMADTWRLGGDLYNANVEHQVLKINTGDTKVLLCDVNGSVCVVDDKICTLYDVIAMYCRYCDYNIMRYETIQFCDNSGSYRTTIRLQHGDVIDKAYVRMYLDAVGLG